MMKISELARHPGASIRSLRYYEMKHLLSPHRQENGYRFYDKTAIEQVRNIQFYLHLGLTAHQIFHIVCCSQPESLLSPFDKKDPTYCSKTIDLYKEKLAEIEEQIAALEKAKTYLRQHLACFMSEKNAEESFRTDE